MRLKHHPAALWWILLVTCVRLAAVEPVEIDVPYFTPVELKEYGAFRRDIIIESDDQGSIRYAIVDHTKTVYRQRLNGQVLVEGRYLSIYRGYDKIPLIRRRTLPKEGGISVPGTLKRMYRLYRDRTGAAVYFVDTLASPQGSVRLRILPATRTPAR